MRRGLALLLVSLALASPAGAQPSTKTARPHAAPVAVAPPPQTALAPLIPLASDRPGGDAIQCRSACARSYYFCKANDDDICPSQWAQCTARCTSSYRRLGS